MHTSYEVHSSVTSRFVLALAVAGFVIMLAIGIFGAVARGSSPTATPDYAHLLATRYAIAIDDASQPAPNVPMLDRAHLTGMKYDLLRREAGMGSSEP